MFQNPKGLGPVLVIERLLCNHICKEVHWWGSSSSSWGIQNCWGYWQLQPMVKEGIWKWPSIAMAINIWTVETCLDLPQTRTIILFLSYIKGEKCMIMVMVTEKVSHASDICIMFLTNIWITHNVRFTYYRRDYIHTKYMK